MGVNHGLEPPSNTSIVTTLEGSNGQQSAWFGAQHHGRTRAWHGLGQAANQLLDSHVWRVPWEPVPNQASSSALNVALSGHSPAATGSSEAHGAEAPATKPPSRFNQAVEFGVKLDKALKPAMAPLSILSTWPASARWGSRGRTTATPWRTHSRNQEQIPRPPASLSHPRHCRPGTLQAGGRICLGRTVWMWPAEPKRSARCPPTRRQASPLCADKTAGPRQSVGTGCGCAWRRRSVLQRSVVGFRNRACHRLLAAVEGLGRGVSPRQALSIEGAST